MGEPSDEQSGGMLAAPTPRQRRSGIAAVAGAALAAALAAVALITMFHTPDRRHRPAHQHGGRQCLD